MITDLTKVPFPWFGGKRQAAPLVWAALGDVDHYVEPFAGSCAVLLGRPHAANRAYHSETVNDASGLLVNALRSIQYSPDATADAASRFYSEAEIMACQLACLDWANAGNLERLMADVAYHDPVIGGYWLFGICGWIGSGWCAGDGPWVVGSDGRITKRPKANGVMRKRPHLTSNGQGVSRPQLREAGVARQRPHLTSNGQGVSRPQLREAGVARKRPHLGNNGQGVSRPQLREAGVARKLPHLTSNGQGVSRPQLREAGVARQLPHLGNNGQGINHAGTRENGVATGAGIVDADAAPGLIIPDDLVFHPRVMPELSRWLQFLSARLRHVRIVNGDWTRVCTTGALYTLPVRQGGVCGVLLDPPYSIETDRAMGLYSEESGDIAHAVRAWCKKMGDDPRLRIVLCGFDTEHTEMEAHGWRVVEWFKGGFLTGGMANQSANGHSQHRERLWFSPHCLKTNMNDLPLFTMLEDD